MVNMLEVSEKEECVVAIRPLKNPLWVGAATEMRTQYLPGHLPLNCANWTGFSSSLISLLR